MSSIIEVKNLSKSYTISHEGKEKYTTLRDVVSKKAKKLFSFSNSLKSESNGTKEEFWALKDVNFEIAKGERVGIIGRNGAGKSTLLKILSRIVEPTSGSIKIKGRVASLLEVGTGFHPELSGRENIFLNGAILGMSRSEIRKHFDAIVDFAEIEKFLDTPVKRYSSGMYVRLAFAVAAHLEPEILIIDEVLAVGDAQFQKKCLGKMEDVSMNEGRTVLFVSHNMAAIKSLCTKGMVLEKGSVAAVSNIENVVSYYLSGNTEMQNKRTFKNYDNQLFNLQEISLNPKDKSSDEALNEYQEIELNTIITIKDKADHLHLTYVLNNEMGEPLFTFSHINQKLRLSNGINYLKCIFPKGFLNIGTFYLSLYLIEDAKNTVFVEKDILSFNVQEGERNIGSWMGKEPGFIKPVFEWKIKQE